MNGKPVQRSTSRSVESDVSRHRDLSAAPIAVVGIGCRFAGGADSPEALWRLLLDEVDAVTETPPGTRGTDLTAPGAYLPDVAGFDAEFFGIGPREAAEMDPQQRLALELAWEVFEDAGIRAETVPETGVYFANKFNDYRALKLARGPAGITPFTSTGDVEGVIANRVSHFLGLDGPSMTVNASCAGSLIAVHLACQALRAGECATAIAGGVHLNVIPETTAGLAALGVLSPTGRSRAFDATADGYVRGEGGAVVLLKPLSEALRDGDRVYCTILGGATNNNGRGRTMPASSPEGQRQLLRRACRHAGIDPETVDYVEAHGTGTVVGDHAELVALGAEYGTGRAEGRELLVGSVKTNIGHTEAASGIAGLAKTALALRHGRIPRTLHFRSAPDDIDLSALGLRITAEAQDWPTPTDRVARAGVSAFGFGGSNAHLLLEAPPVPGRTGRVHRGPSDRAETSLRHGVDGVPVTGTMDESRSLSVTTPSVAPERERHRSWWPWLLGRARRPRKHPSAVSADMSNIEVTASADISSATGKSSTEPGPEITESDALAWGRYRLVAVSARTDTALREHIRRLRDHLLTREVPDEPTLDDIAYTLCETRMHFSQRYAWVTDSVDALISELTKFLDSDAIDTPEGHSTTAGLLAAALHPDTVTRRELLETIAAAYRQGLDPEWESVNPAGRAIPLPTYPFQRQRYWVDTPVHTDPDIDHGRIRDNPRPAVDEWPQPADVHATELVGLVTTEVAMVTGLPAVEIPADRNFAELAFTSVHALELSSRLTARLNTTLPAAVIWGHPTVRGLAAELARRLHRESGGDTGSPTPPPRDPSTIVSRASDTDGDTAATPPHSPTDSDTVTEVLSTAELLALADKLRL
ncbi:beta-ketoacyl synthase N-terminal-like domain-containing protein [Nocardia paucivorans]|uniref:beta-ketoacyl synthase N-terminal-like domain-containing protein n=1 Tax=Nocardia paucivorans TaxID=114259 RepID=UPI0012FBD8CB|nr:beta-ketoacyl synthase N-terminal-like domain-containing protein [Nocardia paucivorans]